MHVGFTPLGQARSTMAYYVRDAGYAPGEDTGPGGRRARYYARDHAEHRRASAWFGRGAAALGLSGPVRAQDFERVLRGEVPGTDTVLRRNRDGAQEHRTGWDLTLSLPKSLSVLWALLDDERIRDAFGRAVEAALRYAEDHLLETRGYDRETGRRDRVRAEGLVAARFLHVSNRNDEPQLHVHVIIVNMTRLSGEWRSVEPSALARHTRLLGALAGNALARELRAFGYGLVSRRVGRLTGFEAAGFSRRLLARFSTRRRDILRRIAETGARYTTHAAQRAAFATRRRKSGLRETALRQQWRALIEADPRLANALANAARASRLAALEAGPALSALEAVCRAVEHLEERATVLRERDVLATALLLDPGRQELGALAEALERRRREGHLVEAKAYRSGGRAFVPRRALADEKALIAWMRDACDSGSALGHEAAVERRLAATRLTRGQRDAVRLIVCSRHRAVAVQGFAGTGKTTMMREVVALAGERAVLGLAPSAAATRVLGNEAQIPARTVDWFLTRYGDLGSGRAGRNALAGARARFAGGLLIVDECSMLSTAQMRALARLCERLGVARTVLCGDHRQLQSVRPGQPFRLLQEAGMPTAVMDEIVRQRHPVLRKAVRDALAGRPARALAYLGERLEEVEPQGLAERAAHELLALAPEERAHTLVVAPTNALRRDINAAVRDGLIEEGVVHGGALVLERLIDLRLTGPEKANPANYQAGDEVVFVQDLLHYRVRSGDACLVTGIEGARVRLRHPEGTARHIDPRGPVRHQVKVCESAPIEIRAGDRIRWTHNDKARGLLNGETARIERIGRAGVTLCTTDGRALRLAGDDRQLRHIDFAYASTAHAAQGATCERVIAVLDADPMPLTNQLTFYVQISRARAEVTVLTDDGERLIETLEAQSGERESAHEAVGWTPGPGDAAAWARRRGYERVRRDWRRVRRRARGQLAMAVEAQGYAGVRRQVEALDAEPALPAYMRGFVDEWLGEDRACEDRERALGEVLDGATRLERPGGGGAAPDDEEETVAGAPGEASWGEAERGLLARARRIRDDPGGYGAHLEALEGGRARFDRAQAGLEARALRATDAAVAQEAEGAGTIAFHAPGYPDLLKHAKALKVSMLPLPEADRARAGEVVAEDAKRHEERADVEAVIDGARERAIARPPGPRWNDEDRALLTDARQMLEHDSAHAAHLDADKDLRRRFHAAASGLEAEAFRAADSAVGWETSQRHTIAFYAPAYPAFVKHAKALAESTLPLPEADRARAGEVVAEDAKRREERRTLGAYLHETEPRARALTKDGAWNERDRTLRAFARAMRERGSPYRPHLDADRTLRSRFESTCAGLEAGAFRAADTAVAGEANETGTIAFYAPGYPDLLKHAKALKASTLPLPDADRTRAAEVVAEEATCREERARLETFLAEAEQREKKRATGKVRSWRDAGLLVRRRRIGRDEDACAAHLDADEELRRRFDAASAGLEAGALVHTHATVEKQAAKRGAIAYYARGYPKLLGQARALADSALPLPDDARALAERIVAEDARHRAARERIDGLLESLSQVLAARPDWDCDPAVPGEDAATRNRPPAPGAAAGAASSHGGEPPAGWEAQARPVVAQVRALLAGEGEDRAHLDAVAGRREDTERGLRTVAFHCACAERLREWDSIERRAEGVGLDHFFIEGFDEALGSIRTLRDEAPETEALSERLERASGHPERLVGALRAGLEKAHEGHAALLSSAAATRTALHGLDGYAAWHEDALSALQRPTGVLAQRRRLEAHLGPDRAGLDVLEASVQRIKDALDRDWLARSLCRERRAHGIAAAGCAAHEAFDAPWYPDYISEVKGLDAEKAHAAEVPPELARDLAEHDKRMRLRGTRKAMRGLCEARFALLGEAARLGETLERKDYSRWNVLRAGKPRRAFRERRRAWWERVDHALASARRMLHDRETYGHLVDALETAREPMARDVEELELTARVAPMPAALLRRWRTHVGDANEHGVHPFEREGYVDIHHDMQHAVNGLEPDSEARETLEGHRVEFANWADAKREREDREHQRRLEAQRQREEEEERQREARRREEEERLHRQRCAAVEHSLVTLRSHVASRLRAARRGAAPDSPSQAVAQEVDAARRHLEQVRGPQRDEHARVLEEHPRWERRMRRALSRLDALPHIERLHAAGHGLEMTVSEGRRMLLEAGEAGRPALDAEAHRQWCAQARKTKAQTVRALREEGDLAAQPEKRPKREQRIEQAHDDLGAWIQAHELWMDWSALRGAVAKGTRLDREALGTDAPVTCSAQYRQWHDSTARPSEGRVRNRLEDEHSHGWMSRARPAWKDQLREDLSSLVRLRERHRLCALAVGLRETVRSREALETDSRTSGRALTTLRGYAPYQSDALERTQAARQVLESWNDPLHQRLGELPALRMHIHENLKALGECHRQDEREQAKRLARNRSRNQDFGMER